MTTAEKIYQAAHAAQEAQEVQEIELFLENHPAVEDIIRTLLELPEGKRAAAVKMLLDEVEKNQAEQ